jgi:quinone-modifying oxidoreductase, subunit QmoC
MRVLTVKTATNEADLDRTLPRPGPLPEGKGIYVVKPDSKFLADVLQSGGGDLKKCYQCATCAVVCDLNSGQRPFPRKEMLWAQWGLKDRLVADPDIWCCHQCNDCSTRCPRGARPGDVLAALRQQTIEHYAVPQQVARCVNQVKYLPLMLLIPAVLLVVALLLRDPVYKVGQGVLQYAQHPGFYADLFPHWLLIGFFSFFWGLAMLGALTGIVRFWLAMKAADEAAGRYQPTVGIVPSIVNTVKLIFTHDKFAQCQAKQSRRWAHLGAFYGFVALFLVSVWAVVALYMINPLIANHEQHLLYPFALWNPWKILANLGCIALIAGCIIAIRDRLSGKPEAGANTSFDWLFVALLFSVGTTGLLTELLRLIASPGPDAATPLQLLAYAVYFVHLVVVFQLLVYLPYSKFAHVLYRTVALVYVEHSGRNHSH